MSGQLAGKVWDSALRPGLKPLAAVLADLAQDDGSRIYPSVEYVAWRLGVSARAVQYGLTELREAGVLAVVKQGGGACATEYILVQDKLPQRPTWKESRVVKPASPVQPASPVKTASEDRCNQLHQGGEASFTLSVNRTVKGTAKKKRAPKTGALEFPLPEWMPRDAWDAYLKLRKRKRAAVDADAAELLVGDLAKWRNEGQDVRAILEKSVKNGWTGIFPVRENHDGQSKGKQPFDLAANHAAFFGQRVQG